MADRSRGILDLLWRREGRLTPELLADVLLMAVLADGRLTEGEVDALSWTMAHRPELAGLEWDWLILRASEVAEDAPLFFDLRQHLAASVTDPKDRRVALTLANRVAGAHGPLAEEEQALLRSLAEAFGIGEAEQTELLRAPPPGSPRFTWRRSSYSDPTAPAVPFFDALARAADPGEARILIHRLHAIRALWDTRFRDGKLCQFGHRIEVDDHHVRIDGVFLHNGRTAWLRTLATGEALYPRERKLLARLLAQRPKDTDLYVTHTGPLSPADRSTLENRSEINLVELAL